MHAHVYVLFYDTEGRGSILMRTHILSLKGADVITIHCFFFPPDRHEKHDVS